MRESEDFDTQPSDETSVQLDPEYIAALKAYDEGTRRALDDAHSECSIENPFGLCALCEEAYRKAKEIGAEDARMGLEFALAQATYLAFHPELPRVYQGAIEGYAHGYTKETLRSVLTKAGARFEGQR